MSTLQSAFHFIFLTKSKEKERGSFWILDEKGKSKVKHVQQMSSSLLECQHAQNTRSGSPVSLLAVDHNDGQFFRAMEWLMFF